MGTTTRKKLKKEDSRIEIRVSSEDKNLFEYAKDLHGSSSLSEYIRFILHRESKAIIEENDRVLASQRDREIFFSALMDDKPKVNPALVSAFKRNKEFLSK